MRIPARLFIPVLFLFAFAVFSQTLPDVEMPLAAETLLDEEFLLIEEIPLDAEAPLTQEMPLAAETLPGVEAPEAAAPVLVQEPPPALPQPVVAAAPVLSALQNYEIGRGHEAQNRMSEANVYYNEAIRIAQDEIARNVANANTYTVMTWAMRRQNRHADVLLWGARGLELYANAHSLVETMGQSLFFLGDHTRALNYMRRYVNSVPIGGRAPVAYFFKGEIYRLRGQFHSADIAYTTAVSLHPNLALWWFRLGSVREAIGDYPYAIAAFQQAVNLSPNLAGASAALARSQLQLSGQ